MSFACMQASLMDDLDMPEESEDDLFAVRRGHEAKDEQEILLGSRLEEELNRSIENLRQLENPRHTELLNSNGSGKEELLEDIEIPTLSSSSSIDLVSISSESSGMSAKQNFALWDKVKGRTSTSKQTNFGKDIADKIIALGLPVSPKFLKLLSIEESELPDLKHVTGSGLSGNVPEASSIIPKEKSANMTSSPISSGQPSLSFLNLDEMSDSLLSSSLLTSPITKPTDDLPVFCEDEPKERSVWAIEERIKELNKIIGTDRTSLPLTPSCRMTLGGINTFEMDELNDSLLSSFRMAKSPILEDESSFHLPTISKNNLKEKAAETKSTVFGGLGTEGLERLLNESNGNFNRSRSLNDLPVDTEKIFALGKTFGSLGKLTDGPDGTFLLSSAKALNNTFDRGGNQVDIVALDSTVSKVKESENHTFCAQSNKAADGTFELKQDEVANTTFDLESVRRSDKCSEQSVNNDMHECDAKDGKDPEKLNVTFEKGEYHIPTLNETVNLMDAEGDVLKLILDSTPVKPSKIKPSAVSTPKVGNLQDTPAKSTITKDPAQSFIRRMSLGVRRNAQNPSKMQKDAVSDDAANPCAPLLGLKGMCVNEQSVASKFRRCQGASNHVKNGPMRALPMACMAVESSGDKIQKNSSDGVDGIKPLDSNSSQEESGSKNSESIGRPQLPSFGSCSSIENERPSTPGLMCRRGVITSTPDASRPGSSGMHPRITSTPAARIIGTSFTNSLGIQGPAPTPISAPPSRSRFTVSSSSSVPDNQSEENPLVGNMKNPPENCVDPISSSAKKCLVMPVAPSENVCSSDAVCEANPFRAKHIIEEPESAPVLVKSISMENGEGPLDGYREDSQVEHINENQMEYIEPQLGMSKMKELNADGISGNQIASPLDLDKVICEDSPIEDMIEILHEKVDVLHKVDEVGENGNHVGQIAQDFVEDLNSAISQEKLASLQIDDATNQVLSMANENTENHKMQENGTTSDGQNCKSHQENVLPEQSEERNYVDKDVTREESPEGKGQDIPEETDAAKLECCLENAMEKEQENVAEINCELQIGTDTIPNESLKFNQQEMETITEVIESKSVENEKMVSIAKKNLSLTSSIKHPRVMDRNINESRIIDENINETRIIDENINETRVIDENVNETRIIDQPKFDVHLGAGLAKVNKGKGLARKAGPGSKINTHLRRSTVEKCKSPSTENKVSSLKKKVTANKENLQVNNPNGTSVSPTNINKKLGPKLPSQRMSLAPSNGQVTNNASKEHVRGSQLKGNFIAPTNKDQKLGAKLPPKRVSLAPNGQTSACLDSAKKQHASVRNGVVRANGTQTKTSLVSQNRKAIPETGFTATSSVSRLQPPTRLSQQQLESAKLSSSLQSHAGNAVKGVVQSKGTTISKLPSRLPSKLPAPPSRLNSGGVLKIGRRP